MNKSDISVHKGCTGNIITSNINDYNKSAQMIIFFCNKYEKNCCSYNRIKYLFILADRYHIRKYGNTISNSRMYKYNYFLTMLKKYIEKNNHFKFVDDILYCDCIINNQIFSDIELKSLNYVFDYFKKYNNSQLQRYMREHLGLVNYCTQLFPTFKTEEYCEVDQLLLEQNVERYEVLCDYKDQIGGNKSIRNVYN